MERRVGVQRESPEQRRPGRLLVRREFLKSGITLLGGMGITILLDTSLSAQG